ncbi:MAG: MBL fold metallo-hydrolase [Methanobacteriota archaeon]
MNSKGNFNVRIMWFGHSCLKMQTGNTSLYLDPVRENHLLRTTLNPRKERKASAIFISHEHWDHFDSNTVMALSNDSTTICCPRTVGEPLSLAMSFEAKDIDGLRKLFKRMRPCNVGDSVDIAGVQVRVLQATEGLAFLIIYNGKKILFMGDSIATKAMIKEAPDIVFFPVWAIIGKEANLDSFLKLGEGATCIPIHFHNSKKSFPNFYAKVSDIRKALPRNVKIVFMKREVTLRIP